MPRMSAPRGAKLGTVEWVYFTAEAQRTQRQRRVCVSLCVITSAVNLYSVS